MSKYLKNMNVLIIIGTILIVLFSISIANASEALGKPPAVIKPPMQVERVVPMKITETLEDMELPHAEYHRKHGFKTPCNEAPWYDKEGKRHLNCVWIDKNNFVHHVVIY